MTVVHGGLIQGGRRAKCKESRGGASQSGRSPAMWNARLIRPGGGQASPLPDESGVPVHWRDWAGTDSVRSHGSRGARVEMFQAPKLRHSSIAQAPGLSPAGFCRAARNPIRFGGPKPDSALERWLGRSTDRALRPAGPGAWPGRARFARGGTAGAHDAESPLIHAARREKEHILLKNTAGRAAGE